MATCCQDRLGPKMVSLLDCLAAAMEDCGAETCRLFLTTAMEAPWDTCCECDEGVGQAWVSVAQVVTLNKDGQIRCTQERQATVVVGILRCALVLDEAGNPPDPYALTQEALAVMKDRLIITQAIQCCFGNLTDPDQWSMGPWESLGPRGGCVGGQITITYRFSDPKCS